MNYVKTFNIYQSIWTDFKYHRVFLFKKKNFCALFESYVFQD